MARGGKRIGAGRKKGVPNKASQERQAEVKATGATPLDVMIRDMRFHLAVADQELSKKRGLNLKVVESALAKARLAAKDAAPYVHPSLKAIEHSGRGGGAIEHRITDARGEVERKMAGLVTAGEAPSVPRRAE